MNAYMAKGLTIQKYKDNFDSNINTVMREIENAINKEHTYCTISNSWYNFKYDEVLAHLNELGYVIEKHDTYIKISWNI